MQTRTLHDLKRTNTIHQAFSPSRRSPQRHGSHTNEMEQNKTKSMQHHNKTTRHTATPTTPTT